VAQVLESRQWRHFRPIHTHATGQEVPVEATLTENQQPFHLSLFRGPSQTNDQHKLSGTLKTARAAMRCDAMLTLVQMAGRGAMHDLPRLAYTLVGLIMRVSLVPRFVLGSLCSMVEIMYSINKLRRNISVAISAAPMEPVIRVSCVYHLSGQVLQCFYIHRYMSS